mmetsp:Transcript_3008/g.5079  ORF Transcript_3008/g.5079 Transcript_3008/m.5079 type:complete len:96 (+) Transcript_3008:357-644(+)
MTDMVNEHFSGYLTTLDRLLGEKADKKYLVSDEVSIYDITLANIFLNMALNPLNEYCAIWKECYDKNASDRVKKFLEDFKLEFADYLAKRPQCPF